MRVERQASVERRSPRGPLTFVAATEGRKSDGISLLMGGANLANYRRNPVVMWSHRYSSLPVGRATDVRVSGRRLLADVEFDTSDPFAAEIDRKYREGWLSAVSAAFRIDRWQNDDSRSGVAERWTLTEISTVPVPLDSQALVTAGRKRASKKPSGRRLTARELRQRRELRKVRDELGRAEVRRSPALDRAIRDALYDVLLRPAKGGRK